MPRPQDGYLNFVSSGDPDKLARPPDAKLAVGITKGEPIPFQWLNYFFYLLDQWVQYLDQEQGISNAANSTFSSMRLIGGGYWNYNTGSPGTLAWTNTFYLTIPGLNDSQNACSTSSVALADGQIAYVNANIPVTTTGNTTSGNATVTNVASTLGIAVGQSVYGFGIAPNTTVLAINDESTITLSKNALGEGISATLQFVSAGPLTMQVAIESQFVPQANSVIVARCVGAKIYIGVNANVMTLQDAEWKQLLGDGYAHVINGPFGQNLTQGQAVYISDGTDGRTVGNFYLCQSDGTYGATRGRFAGFVMTSGNAGTNGNVVAAGCCSGFFFALSPGKIYYVDPTNPGGITSTQPSTTGQYIIPVGLAQDATDLYMSQPGQSTIVQSLAPWPNYGVSSEAQLQDALSKCATAGGGVILLQAAFSVAGVQTMSNNTKIVGRGKSTALTFGLSARLVMGSACALQDCYLQNTGTTGGTLLTISGDLNVVQDSTFAMLPTNSNGICVVCTGTGNLLLRVCYVGVVGGTAATGLQLSGAENKDADSTYTQG